MSLDGDGVNTGCELGADLLERIGVSTSKSLVGSQSCKIGESNLKFMVSGLFSEGHAAEDMPYDIFLVGHNHVTSDLIMEMKLLQDQICGVKAPHSENPVDYKSEQEFNDHFSAGGRAIVFANGNRLVGCCMLSEDTSSGLKGVFQKGVDNMPDTGILKVGFLAVDPEYAGFKLAKRLLDFAQKVAKDDGLEGIEAGVRLWNKKAMRRFSGSGFVGTSISPNAKDGCPVLKMGKVFNVELGLDTQKGWDRLIASPAEERGSIEDSLNRGGVLAWHTTGGRFAIYPADQISPDCG